MTIPAGFIINDYLPHYDQPSEVFFQCSPKAGIMINCGVTTADGTETIALDGSDEGAQGNASISLGAVDDAANARVASYGSSLDFGSFNDAGSYVGSGAMASFSYKFPNRTVGGLVNMNGFAVPGGWKLNQGSVYPDTGSRQMFLGLQGNNMVSEVGTFTIPTTGASVLVNGMGFDPDIVIVFGADGGDAGGIFSVGAIDSSDTQWSAGYSADWLNLLPLNVQSGWFKPSMLCIAPTTTPSFSGQLGHEAYGQMVAGGFNIIPVTPPPTEAAIYGYLAIHDPDGEFKVGSGSMVTGESGLSSKPEAVLFATTWASDNVSHGSGGISIGYKAAVGYDARGFLGAGGQLTASCFTENDYGQPERWRTNSSLYSLVQTDSSGAVLKSFLAKLTPTGFTTTATDGGRQYGWVTLRGSFQDDCPAAWVPDIYRYKSPRGQ